MEELKIGQTTDEFARLSMAVVKDTIRIEKTEYDRLMKQSILLDVLLRILFSEPVGKNCTVFDARRLAKAVVGASECERVSAELGEDNE